MMSRVPSTSCTDDCSEIFGHRKNLHAYGTGATGADMLRNERIQEPIDFVHKFSWLMAELE